VGAGEANGGRMPPGQIPSQHTTLFVPVAIGIASLVGARPAVPVALLCPFDLLRATAAERNMISFASSAALHPLAPEDSLHSSAPH
jgi:hypothetical protein